MKQTYVTFSYKTLHIMRRIISKFKAVLAASYFSDFRNHWSLINKQSIIAENITNTRWAYRPRIKFKHPIRRRKFQKLYRCYFDVSILCAYLNLFFLLKFYRKFRICTVIRHLRVASYVCSNYSDLRMVDDSICRTMAYIQYEFWKKAKQKHTHTKKRELASSSLSLLVPLSSSLYRKRRFQIIKLPDMNFQPIFPGIYLPTIYTKMTFFRFSKVTGNSFYLCGMSRRLSFQYGLSSVIRGWWTKTG